MDALKTQYGIVKTVQNANRPDYVYHIMRKGARPLEGACPICQFGGIVGVVAPIAISNKGNNYQLVSTRLSFS